MAIAKAKINETAQKLVAQGKLRDAVAEYQKILKEEPKEVNTLNSIGDLHVRLNNIPEALQYFTKLADIYVSDGFLVRGIAMYKKIAKLDPANAHAGERLAELYTMQGLFGEARAQYLQLAEAYLKNKKLQEATNVLQKLIDLEPDNLQIQQRLAALYQDHGRKDDAANIYGRLAERLLQREDTDEALKWLEKATKLAPEHPHVLLIHARLLVEQGDAKAAVARLEKIPKLGESAEAVELLLKCRLELGEVDKAAQLAEDAFARNPQQFGGLLQVAEQLAEKGERDRAVVLFERIAAPALEQGEPARVVSVLRHLVKAKASAAAEWLVTAARKASDHDALVLGLGALAKQCFEKKDFPRARELYEELVQLAPGVSEYAQRLQQAKEKLGEATEPAAVPQVEPVAEPAVSPAPAAVGEVVLVSEENLDPDTRSYVSSSLTDIDLFSQYGMTQKAVELAEQVVRRVPGHLVANEKLLDFYVGGGDQQQVTIVARRLEQLYRQKGDLDRAEQVAQIAHRYQDKAGVATAEAPAEEVHEVDLSAEWATTTEEAPAAEVELPQFKADEVREEIGFYIDQGMLNEARMALDRYVEQFPDEPVLAELRQRLTAAAAPKPKPKAAPAPPPPPPPAPEPVEEISLAELSEVTEEVEEVTPAPKAQEPAEVAATPEESFEITLEKKPQETGSMSAKDFFSDLAGELEATLPAEIAAEAKAPAPTPTKSRARAAASQEGAAALAEVFDEFKQELGAAEEVEDIETHYNLGIAFKEMGLYDEAISEFQKVYKAAENQEAYPNLIQCCTLLGLCFMDKGLPAIAVQWYERALKAPGIDPEGALALRYDMGVAHEQAGNRKAALECFMEVYGLNVDFRDVGERIRQLQQ